MSVIGGMMKTEIPDYRLPPEILDLEIDVIKRMGVEIATDAKINDRMSFGPKE
jgi:NADPH-dependent glutamate synthase beta subunit-like oxidoreductase